MLLPRTETIRRIDDDKKGYLTKKRLGIETRYISKS